MDLRTQAPWRVLDGYGRAVQASSRYVTPRSSEELAETLAGAQREGLKIAFRGSGRSYGDAALNTDGLVIDMGGMNRMLAWDPVAGVAEAQSGLTIEGLWRRTIQDGFWPHVVPGTMAPTLGGALSMNIHGKNNFKAGPFGEYVESFELVTASGDVLRCARDENPDVFHAAIGGLGLLGAITKTRLRLHKVDSGYLRVKALAAPDLDGMFDGFEAHLPTADYLVGWVDCTAGGAGLGRGQIHKANYLTAAEDPDGAASFNIEKQILPGTIFGIPKSILWRFMRPFFNNLGAPLVNTAKYVSSVLGHDKDYLQSHVGFAFLLDYVPNWRLAYGAGGFIQYQVFLPYAAGRPVLKDILALCKKRGLPSYLGVLKRHRPDSFLLSHAVDGWSMAMDFRVTKGNRADLWALTEAMTARVLEAGGRFYFAKDAVLRADEAERAYGADRFEAFHALKRRLDPEGVFETDLARRVFAGRLGPAAAPAAPLAP